MARFLWAALCVALFACVWSFPVRANDVQLAAGVVCDTAEQATMFGSMFDEMGAEKALAKVNEDAKDPIACVATRFAFIAGTKHGVVRAAGKDWTVTEILVVGVMTGHGVQRVPPKVFFTLIPATDTPA